MSWLRSTVSVLGVAALTALVAPGCADNESMLFIVGALAVESTDCVAKPQKDALLRPSGVLDLALRSGYSAVFLVGSQLTQRGSRDRLRTETARLPLKGAEVTLNDAYNRPLSTLRSNPFSTIGTGFVDPTGGTDPGYGFISVDIVPPSLAADLNAAIGGEDAEIVASVKVFGTTLGGQDVESGAFTYPIWVCHGCLVTYPESSNTGGTEFECGNATQTDSTSSSTVTNCALGQDVPVACSVCASSSDVCKYPCSNCSVQSGVTCDSSTHKAICPGNAAP